MQGEEHGGVLRGDVQQQQHSSSAGRSADATEERTAQHSAHGATERLHHARGTAEAPDSPLAVEVEDVQGMKQAMEAAVRSAVQGAKQEYDAQRMDEDVEDSSVLLVLRPLRKKARALYVHSVLLWTMHNVMQDAQYSDAFSEEECASVAAHYATTVAATEDVQQDIAAVRSMYLRLMKPLRVLLDLRRHFYDTVQTCSDEWALAGVQGDATTGSVFDAAVGVQVLLTERMQAAQNRLQELTPSAAEAPEAPEAAAVGHSTGNAAADRA